MGEMAGFRSAVLQWSAGNAEEAATAADLAAGLPVTTVVLVEGVSDQVAVETLCARRGLDLPAEGICVLPLGGATNVHHGTANAIFLPYVMVYSRKATP